MVSQGLQTKFLPKNTKGCSTKSNPFYLLPNSEHPIKKGVLTAPSINVAMLNTSFNNLIFVPILWVRLWFTQLSGSYEDSLFKSERRA